MSTSRMQELKQRLMQRCGPLPAPQRKLCLTNTFIDVHSPISGHGDEYSPCSAPAVLTDAAGQQELWACDETDYVQELSAKVWEIPLPTIQPLQSIRRSWTASTTSAAQPASHGTERCCEDDDGSRFGTKSSSSTSSSHSEPLSAPSAAPSEASSQPGSASPSRVSSKENMAREEEEVPAPPSPHFAPRRPAAWGWPPHQRCLCCPTPGSHGHSLNLCRLPCRLQAEDGSCPAGDGCGFCHLRHRKATSALDRQNREVVALMDVGSRVALLAEAMREKVEALDLGDQASQLLEAWRDEVAGRCGPPAPQPRGGDKKDQRRLTGALRKLALNVLCRVVKSNLNDDEVKDATERLVDSLRALV